MSRALRFGSAAAVAAIAETGCLWVLSHVVVPHISIAFAAAFATGYLTLIAVVHVLNRPGAGPSLGAQLRTCALFGLAVLLLAEVILYVCFEVLFLDLTTTNAVALAAVACWVALGWPFVSGDAHP